MLPCLMLSLARAARHSGSSALARGGSSRHSSSGTARCCAHNNSGSHKEGPQDLPARGRLVRGSDVPPARGTELQQPRRRRQQRAPTTASRDSGGRSSSSSRSSSSEAAGALRGCSPGRSSSEARRSAASDSSSDDSDSSGWHVVGGSSGTSSRRTSLDDSSSLDSSSSLGSSSSGLDSSSDEADAIAAAVGRLSRFLDFRERCASEVLSKLAEQGHEPAFASRVLAALQRCGLQDDARFAEAFVRGQWAAKAQSPSRLAYELRARGVAQQHIDAALASVFGRHRQLAQREAPSEQEAAAWQQLLEACRRRAELSRGEPQQKRRAKLAGWLQRRGHGMTTVFKVFEALRV